MQEKDHHQIFPQISARNRTASEIGLFWILAMCTHISFLAVISQIKLHQGSRFNHPRAHWDPIYFLISNITLVLCQLLPMRSKWNPRGGSKGRPLDINNAFPPVFENNFATWLTHTLLFNVRRIALALAPLPTGARNRSWIPNGFLLDK